MLERGVGAFRERQGARLSIFHPATHFPHSLCIVLKAAALRSRHTWERTSKEALLTTRRAVTARGEKLCQLIKQMVTC